MANTSITKKLENIQSLELKMAIQKNLLIEKALKGNNPSDIIAASKYASIDERPEVDKKSYVFDPTHFMSNFGYKDKPFTLSYETLRRLSKVPVINAILKTRKNQVADFCEPQRDKYSTGFVIRKKNFNNNAKEKTSKEEKAKIEKYTEFILNCGVNYNWEADDFDTFIRKIVEDSLVFDQMTFEVVRNLKGEVVEFFATDAATYRIADSYNDDEFKNSNKYKNIRMSDKSQEVRGYLPSYVQVLNGAVESEFYPWELCFGIRNPTTNIYNNGYGISELEELVSVITSLLYSDQYNQKFFSQGSAPKGLLRVKGNLNEKTLGQFRQSWQSMVSGVMNAWKTPIVEADVDWIDLQKTNNDMQFAQWQEYLIKLACAIYAIDPNEIGFNINGSGDSAPMFEGNNEKKLKHSKDKGLYPILKFVQRKINKHIMTQLDPEYELLFMGMNGVSISDELDMDIKKAGSFMTLNEIREKNGLEGMKEEGDIILNPYYMQTRQQQQMQQQGGMGMPGQEQGGQEEEEEDNPFDFSKQDEQKADTNKFAKAYGEFLDSLEK